MRMQGLAAPDTDLWLSLAVALGAGLLIGIERERRKGDGATRDFAGVRTFAMAALMGTVTQSLAQVWLVVVQYACMKSYRCALTETLYGVGFRARI